MPETNRFKKRRASGTHNSVDGFVPRRTQQLPGPQYYRPASTLSGAPRRPIANHRRPIDAESQIAKEPVGPVSSIGNFDQEEIDVFDDQLAAPPNRSRQRGRKRGDKEKKKPGRIRRWWKNRSRKFKVFFILGIIALVLGGLLGYRLYNFLNSVFGRGIGNSSSAALNDNVRPEDLNTEGDGRLNVLLLGRGGAENEAPDLTDTLLIASIDLQNKSTALLSIPRDTYVDEGSDNYKINGVFSRAKEQALYNDKDLAAAEDEGIKATIAAIRNVTGVPIHKYALTDYKAFRDVVNALGGVDVTVPETIYDGFTGWRFQAGPQTMNGDKALQYARTRHGSARGDFDRTENQRRLLVGMRKKATSAGIVANPVRLNSLANAVQKNIRTDLSLDEARAVFDKTKDMLDNNIKSLDLAKDGEALMTTGQAAGQSIVRPVLGLTDNTEIRAFARTNMIDPFLRKEAPTIAVYNGSEREGVATFVGDVMTGYGYKVLEKESAKESQTKTMIIKVNKDADKSFTERFLTVRFGTVIGTNLPGNVLPLESKITTTAPASNSTTASKPRPDYIIILGSDWTSKSGPTW
ncbi:LytR family transcriptional regulator [Candidatus Saccharibacteria bacterium]|nr:MAG: LytR family transcriptional regulator [Candidatus Saccharibacteria bacterium]